MGYDEGAKVDVLYPKSDPANGVVDSFAGMWLWPLILGGLGAVFVAGETFLRSRGEGPDPSKMSAEELIDAD